MSELVGSIMYEVTLDTSKMISEQRNVDQSVNKVSTSLNSITKATRTYSEALKLEAAVAKEAADSSGLLATATSKAAQAIGSLGSEVGGVAGAMAESEAATTAISGALAALGTTVLGIASAIGIAIVGFVKGRQESTEFNRSLELTGNISGLTVDKLGEMAERLDSLSNVTRAKAAESLNIFVASGVRGGEAIEKFTEAAIRMEQAGGASIEHTARAFKDLEKDPLKAALKLNESVNFLSASILHQISTLEQQGRSVDAAKVAQDAFADAILTRTPKITENIGLVEKAWRAVASAAKEGWDAVLNIGREKSPEERIAATRQQIVDLQRQLDGGGFATTGGGAATGRGLGKREREQKEALLATLQETVRLYDRAQLSAQALADADAQRLRQVQAIAEFDKEGEKFLDKKAKMERDIAQARELGKQAGLSELQIEERIKAIRTSYADKTQKFDAVGYLIGLQEKAAEGYAKIDAAERAALQRNAQLLNEGKIDFQQAEEAKTLIAAAAVNARQKLWEQEKAQAFRLFESDSREMQRQAAERQRAGDYAGGIIAGAAPEEDRLVLQYEQRNERLRELRAQNLIDEQTYSAALIANSQQTTDALVAIAQQRAEAEVRAQLMTLHGVSGVADQLLAVLRSAGKEQSALAKAAFLAQKAIAVAEILLNTEVGAAKAVGMAGPFGIPLATFIRTTGYASAGMVAGLAIGQAFGGGRQYGGPVTAGSLYRVNEGGRPEMFTAANGAQYMMPTANGNVTPAGGVGHAGGWTINIHNAPVGTTANVDEAARIIEISVAQAEARVVDSITERRGLVWGAFAGNTNLRGAF
ncbi:MAG: phage tail length tape measure family protein [Reyranellaceae bacterium]